jgi:hypothetical protein
MASSTLINELMALGVAEDEAKYVTGEYQAGYPIVAVRTEEHEQEIMDILQSQAGYKVRHSIPFHLVRAQLPQGQCNL